MSNGLSDSDLERVRAPATVQITASVLGSGFNLNLALRIGNARGQHIGSGLQLGL